MFDKRDLRLEQRIATLFCKKNSHTDSQKTIFIISNYSVLHINISLYVQLDFIINFKNHVENKKKKMKINEVNVEPSSLLKVNDDDQNDEKR